MTVTKIICRGVCYLKVYNSAMMMKQYISRSQHGHQYPTLNCVHVIIIE